MDTRREQTAQIVLTSLALVLFVGIIIVLVSWATATATHHTPVTPTHTTSAHPCHPRLVRYDLDVSKHAYDLDRAGHRRQAFNYLGTHYKAIAKDECR